MTLSTIIVSNQSGATHTYILSQGTPRTSNPVDQKWPLAIYSAKVPNGNDADFRVGPPEPYYAYAITSPQQPGHGKNVDVISRKPVVLGTEDKKGSSIIMVVEDGVPVLRDHVLPDNGNVKSFELKTGTDFTEDIAKRGNFLVGLGDKDVPYGLLAPLPTMTIQLQPRVLWYLTFADLVTGALIDIAKVPQSLEIDLDTRDSPIRVTHQPDGKLAFDVQQ